MPTGMRTSPMAHSSTPRTQSDTTMTFQGRGRCSFLINQKASRKQVWSASMTVYGHMCGLSWERKPRRVQTFITRVIKVLITLINVIKFHNILSRIYLISNLIILIFVNNKQTDWAQLLPSIMFSYRTTPAIVSTNYSPYFIPFGKECRMPLDTALIPSTHLNQTTEQHLSRITDNQKIIRELVSENITKAQAKYKAQHDKNAAIPAYEVQSNVWLYNPRTPKELSPKLINRWVGPFYVSEKLSNCNFRLRHLKTHKAIKSVVHANCLKPYFDPGTRPTNPPPGLQEPVGIHDTEEDIDSDEENEVDQQPVQQKKENEDSEEVLHELQQADTTATLQENLNPEKIIRAYPNFRGEGRMLYKVRYRDNTTNKTQTTYTYDTKLPEAMRKDFHIKYTYSGKVRKRPQQRPVECNQ